MAKQVADRSQPVPFRRAPGMGQGDALVGSNEPVTLVTGSRLENHLSHGVEEERSQRSLNAEQPIKQALVGHAELEGAATWESS
jgi:hypothetical protein